MLLLLLLQLILPQVPQLQQLELLQQELRPTLQLPGFVPPRLRRHLLLLEPLRMVRLILGHQFHQRVNLFQKLQICESNFDLTKFMQDSMINFSIISTIFPFYSNEPIYCFAH